MRKARKLLSTFSFSPFWVSLGGHVNSIFDGNCNKCQKLNDLGEHFMSGSLHLFHRSEVELSAGQHAQCKAGV